MPNKRSVHSSTEWSVRISLSEPRGDSVVPEHNEKERDSSEACSWRQIIDESTTLYWKLTHLQPPRFSFRVCSSTDMWRPAWIGLLKTQGRGELSPRSVECIPTRTRTSHVLTHLWKQTKRAAAKYYEMPGAWAIKRLLILMHLQSDMIFCSIMDGGVEKWVLKPGLWEIKGPWCGVAVHTHAHTHAHTHTHTHSLKDAVF